MLTRFLRWYHRWQTNRGVDPVRLIRAGATVVDVRTPNEFRDGHFPGAVNVPFDQISNKHPSLLNKAQPIVTCCSSGTRSEAALLMLRKAGFSKVYHGGDWTELYRRMQPLS